MLRIGELSDAGRFVIDQFETYLDLAHAELTERRRSVMRRFMWAAIGGLMGALGLAFVGVAIIIGFWSTEYRLAAAIAVPVIFLVIAGISIAQVARGPQVPSWHRFRQEISRDLATLREALWTK